MGVHPPSLPNVYTHWYKLAGSMTLYVGNTVICSMLAAMVLSALFEAIEDMNRNT